jgi:hypothetical protein
MPGRRRKTTDRVADTDIGVEARGIGNEDAITARIVMIRIADIGNITTIGNATAVIVIDPDPDPVVGTTTGAVRIPALEVGPVGKMRNIRDVDAWRGVIRLRLVGDILSAGEIGMIAIGAIELRYGIHSN